MESMTKKLIINLTDGTETIFWDDNAVKIFDNKNCQFRDISLDGKRVVIEAEGKKVIIFTDKITKITTIGDW